MYGIMSTSQNAGGAIAPWVSGAGRQIIKAIGLTNEVGEGDTSDLESCNVAYGWIGPLLIPSVALPLLGVALWMYLPREGGRAPGGGRQDEAKAAASQPSPSMAMAVWEVARDWRQWVVAVAYLLLSIARSVLSDSGLVAMRASSQYATDSSVGLALTALEVGGFAGGIGAGLLSDRVFSGNRSMAIGVLLVACALLLPYVFSVSHAGTEPPLGSDTIGYIMGG